MDDLTGGGPGTPSRRGSPAPQAAAFLDYIAALDAPPPSVLTVSEVRGLVRGWRKFMAAGPPEVECVDRLIGGAESTLPGRLYRPHSPADKPLPLLVYLHGGGWTTGDLDMVDPLCRTLAALAGVGVLSVGYRLAPEAPFPAPVEDAYAALRWAHAEATGLGFDPARIGVGGDSAGGNLAAAVTLMARDRGGPPIAFQLLLYPACDAAMDTPTYRDNARGGLLNAEWMRWFWAHYLAGQDGFHPYASPLRATDLRGLPPAFIATAEFDPLRDEGEAYAARLAEVDVPVEHHAMAGQIHGVAWLSGIIDEGYELIERSAAAVKRALAD